MIKKIGIILFFAAVVGARHAVPLQGLPLLSDTAFADSYTQDGKPCPPECVSDSMEIVTWYPSPWNAYDELRSNRIVVGGGDAEKDPLPPPWGTIAFKPLSSAPQNTSDGTVTKGTMYFDDNSSKFKYSPDGSAWENLGGGEIKLAQYDFSTSQPACNSSNIGLMVFDSSSNRPYVCSNNGIWKTAIWTDKDLIGAVHSSSQCGQIGIEVEDSDGNKFCRVSGSCPAGWSQYENWSTTIKNNGCRGYCCCNDSNPSCYQQCYGTSYHSWSNALLESTSVINNVQSCSQSACYATKTESGCY